MKAISLWQPWASLIVCRYKRIETRSWRHSYRGNLLIHAAKRPYRAFLQDRELLLACNELGLDTADLPTGAIIGQCRLVDISPTDSVCAMVRLIEGRIGDFSPGRFAWHLADAFAFETPIPYVGHQGLFTVSTTDIPVCAPDPQ